MFCTKTPPVLVPRIRSILAVLLFFTSSAFSQQTDDFRVFSVERQPFGECLFAVEGEQLIRLGLRASDGSVVNANKIFQRSMISRSHRFAGDVESLGNKFWLPRRLEKARTLDRFVNACLSPAVANKHTRKMKRRIRRLGEQGVAIHLVDSRTGKILTSSKNLVDLKEVPSQLLSLIVVADPNITKEVLFQVNGSYQHRERKSPYSLNGDFAGELFAWNPAPGSYDIRATVIGKDGQKSEIAKTVVVLEGSDLDHAVTRAADGHLVVVDTAEKMDSKVASFSLVDATTKEVITGYEKLTDESTIDLSRIPRVPLAVRANIEGSVKTGSVRFGFNQNAAFYTDSRSDFYIAGDVKKTAEPIALEVGSNLISAQTFEYRRGSGLKGESRTLWLNVLNSDPDPEPTTEPTSEPSPEPTAKPTAEPTPDPTAKPTSEPTVEPTPRPTSEPTREPTVEPTSSPTQDPTTNPTPNPTVEPTTEPTPAPTQEPTSIPTSEPTATPSPRPTVQPPISEKEYDPAMASYFVDPQLSENCTEGTYSIARRDCSGTDGKALKTLQQVADRVQPGDIVLARSGTYRQTGYVGFTGRGDMSVRMVSSGTVNAPIVFANFPGERPIIDGSELLLGWEKCSSQSDCGGSENWQNLYKKTMAEDVDVNMLFLHQGDVSNPRSLLVAQDPTPLKDSPGFDWQYFTAKQDYWIKTQDGKVGENWIVDEDIFGATSPDLTGAYIVINTCNNNGLERVINSHNRQTGRIDFDSVGGEHCITPGKDAYILRNHIKFLDTPGEYVLAHDSRTIYMWPEDPNALDTIRHGVRSKGFFINGQSHITIQGFEFLGFSAPVSVPSSDGAIVDYDAGGYGSASHIKILNNYFHDIKGGAVVLTPISDSTIANNKAFRTQIGRVFYMSGGSRNLIANNEINRGGRTGLVFFRVTDSAITGNKVVDNLGEHSNAITIYLESENIEVSNNYVRNSNIALTISQSRGFNIHHNIFIGDRTIVAAWASSFKGGNPGDVNFENNTVVPYSPGVSANVYFGDSWENVVVKDNIISSPYEANTHHNNLFLSDMHVVYPEANESFEKDESLIFLNSSELDYRLLGGFLGTPLVDICSMGSDGGYVGALPCIECLDENPVALFFASQLTGIETLSVDFDASRSKGCNGSEEVVNYRWDFGDGTIVEGADKQQVSHDFAAGLHVVKLEVTDNAGRKSERSTRVTAMPALEPNLVLYYNFEEGTGGAGLVADFSGQNNHGEWKDSADQTADGFYTTESDSNKAAKIENGNNVVVPNVDTLRGLEHATFSIDAQKATTNGEGILFSKHGHYSIGLSKGKVVFTIVLETGTKTISVADMLDNQWHKYTMTYDGSRMTAYIDGVSVGQITATGNIANTPYDSWKHRLGNNPHLSVPFYGRLDNYRIYNKSLDASAIADLSTNSS